MRRGGRPLLGFLAIVAIAMHTMLLGVAAPMASASTVDPFSIICTSASHSADQTDQSPASQVPAPAAACDHCNLCSSSAAPSATLDSILAGQLQPPKLLQILLPAIAASHDGITGNSHQARGPPQHA